MRERTSHPPKSVADLEAAPTFEDELDSGANFLRTRIDWMNKSGVPFAGFIISREFAGVIAGWLEQCARDRRREIL